MTAFPQCRLGLEERKIIRKKLTAQIKKYKILKKIKHQWNENTLLKPGRKPECPFAAISVSHCSYIGVFLIAFSDHLSIGFDIEEKQRVTKQILSRIALKQEIQQSPSPSLLWTAKEAGFKCLSRQKNLTLSDCLISNWRKKRKKETYFFNCSYGEKTCWGTAGFIKGFALAYTERRMTK